MTATWASPRSYFEREPPTFIEATVLRTLKEMCDEGNNDIADYVAEAFLKSAPDQRSGRRRAYALLRMAAP